MHKRTMKVRRFYPRQVFNRLRKRKTGTHSRGEMHALWIFMFRANSESPRTSSPGTGHIRLAVQRDAASGVARLGLKYAAEGSAQ